VASAAATNASVDARRLVLASGLAFAGYHAVVIDRANLSAHRGLVLSLQPFKPCCS
jgi:hypothetical protein